MAKGKMPPWMNAPKGGDVGKPEVAAKKAVAAKAPPPKGKK
jgi:hypothetical protein